MRANSACHCVRVSILVFLCVPTWPLGGASKNPIQTVAKAVKSATKAELQSAYSALTEQERKASALVVQLDRQLALEGTAAQTAAQTSAQQTGQVARPARGQAERWKEDEQQLLDIDVAINAGLKDVYTKAAAGKQPENDDLLVRTALLHWTVLLRRMSMQGFHTQVPGLEGDPNCAGDIIGDQLLLRYFDTLFGKKQGGADELDAVKALADLAREGACIGTQQSAILASKLYRSFVELRAFLRLNGEGRLVPYVAQAGAAPLLLFYDVEKSRGLQSPLARWFAENQEQLVEGVATKRIPATWQGLWLYDRRSGHLLGFRVTDDPQDENDVDLGTFIRSIVAAENLGRFECSFAEMIGRGAGLLGYQCAGSTCAQKTGADRGGAGPLAGAGADAERDRRLTNSIGTSTGGVSGGLLQTTACKEGSGLGDDRGRTLCNRGLDIAGDRFLAGRLKCVSEQILKPDESAAAKNLRCLAEAMGKCSSPFGDLTKGLRGEQFAGVRTGRECQYGAGGGGSYVESRLQELKEKWEKEEEALETDKETLKTLMEEVDRMRPEVQAAEREYQRAQEGQREAEASGSDAEKEAARKAAEAAKEKLDDALKAQKDAEAVRKEIELQKQRTENAKKSYEDYEKKVKENNSTYCPPDTPTCGTNDCAALDEATRKTLGCFEQAGRAQDRFSGRPGNVDPSPLDEPTNPAWQQCVRSLMGVPTTPTSKLCWAVDCGPEMATTSDLQGNCRCGQIGTSGAGGLKGRCYNIRCAEGQSPDPGMGCRCIAAGGPVGERTGGRVPTGPFTPSAPVKFSDFVAGVRGGGTRLPR